MNHKLPLALIWFLVTLSCTSSSKENEIRIEVTEDNQYIINGDLADEARLLNKLGDIKTQITGEPKVVLRISPKAKRGTVASLQVVLRKLNFRNILYVDYDEK